MLKGERQLQARFKAIGQTDVLVRTIIIHGVREAKLLVPRKTGNLGRTIRPGSIRKDYGELLAGGQRNIGYARYVELGTKPHIIRPRTKKSLAWGGPRTLGGRLRVSGGVTARPTHFARLVHHPGTKAHAYLRPGLEKAVKTQGIDAIVKLWNGAA